MAHEIDFTNNSQGNAYFGGGVPAWHRYGTVVQDYLTSADAIKAAGMDIEYKKLPVYCDVPTPMVNEEGEFYLEPQRSKVDGKFAVVRMDTNTPLGIVGENYEILSNHKAFEFMDELVGNGDVRYESAGMLKGGRVVWLLAKLPVVDEVVEGDANVPYILLHNSHDGSSSVRAKPTFVRVVCWNTLSVALKQKNKEMMVEHNIRHVGDLKTKIEAVRETIGMIKDEFGTYIGTAKKLAEIRLEKEQIAEFMLDLFPNLANDNPSAKAKRMVVDILSGFKQDHKNNLDGMEESAWGLFNAVTDYIDHHKPAKEPENRFYSSVFGEGDKLKNKAWEKIQELALV